MKFSAIWDERYPSLHLSKTLDWGDEKIVDIPEEMFNDWERACEAIETIEDHIENMVPA